MSKTTQKMSVKWNLKAVLGGMAVGDSFFIPCLDCTQVRKEIRAIARAFGIEVEIEQRTEQYIKGVRTWRVV